MAIIVNIHQRANVETWSVCSLLFAYSSKTKQYYFTSQPCLITFHLSTIRHYLLLHFFSTSSLSHMRHYLGFHFISQQCINLITTVVCSYLSHPTLLTRSLITLASIAPLSHYLLPSSIDHVLSSHAPLFHLRERRSCKTSKACQRDRLQRSHEGDQASWSLCPSHGTAPLHHEGPYSIKAQHQGIKSWTSSGKCSARRLTSTESSPANAAFQHPITLPSSTAQSAPKCFKYLACSIEHPLLGGLN